MKQIDYSYGFVILLSVVCISMQQDPCDSPRPFSNIRQRLPSNKVANKSCLQDKNIDEGWYGEPGIEIPTDPPKYLYCGTFFPAYIHNFVMNTDVAQSNDEDAIIYVTLSSGSKQIITIQTKLCGNSYRIYNLKRIPFPCSSYCIAPVPIDIPTYTAPVAVTVYLTKHRLVFYCNFKQSKDVLWYAVSWYINDLAINTTQRIKTSSDLINQTALQEQQVIDSGTYKVGFEVKCSFRASFRRGGSLGLPFQSDNKFIGIEIITPTVFLDLNTDKPAELKVRATAPIACPRLGCKLDVNVVNFDTQTCKPLPRLAKCRLEVDPKQWNSTVTLDVKAKGTHTYGNDVTARIIGLKTNGYFGHPFWGEVDVGQIKVQISQNSKRIEGNECYALGMHMKTFTGRHYDILPHGTFTLFRNTKLQQEIQITTEPCHNIWSTPCICGLSIRAGRQVYEFNHCGGRNRWEIGYTLCDDVEGIFDVGVSGSNYEITFSSKTKVTVRIDVGLTSNSLNVHLYPSNLDYDISDGLCGTLADVNGVFKYRNGKVLRSYTVLFLKSWRVPSNEIDLFNAGQIKQLTPDSYPVYPCNCPNFSGDDLSITCTDGTTQPTNCAKVRKFRKSRTCKDGSRTKRHVINQFNQIWKPHTHVEKREAPSGWRNGWTEKQARAFCLQLFNRSKAVKLCTEVPNVDQTGPLQNCIADIELIGDTSLSAVAVESIKNKCYHEVESNTTLQDSTSETPSIFQQIQEVACINECSDHGNCTNGTCNCEKDYGGIDCSINIRDAPIVESVFNNGYCTIKDNCREISVYGQTFLDTGNTHCKVRAEELFVKTGVIQDAGEYKHQAHVESIGEAMCTLPKSRKKKSTVTEPEESNVKVYYISVTNDGNAYSNEFPVVVFNSVCQSCNIVGVNVDCSIVDGYCASGTRCYSNGEPLLNNDCFTCSVNSTNRAWIYSKDKH